MLLKLNVRLKLRNLIFTLSICLTHNIKLNVTYNFIICERFLFLSLSLIILGPFGDKSSIVVWMVGWAGLQG